MPRDARLYMTFPIDFHRHPKLTRLPVDVRWTFVEMNGEARLADNDGRFSAEDAEFMWSADHLTALLASHPSRPLVVRDGTDYVIRDYGEHQETRAIREERVRRNRENGAKGGRPPKNRPATDSKPAGFPFGTDPQPTETQTKAESESEGLPRLTESQSSSTRARVSTDAIPISDMTKKLAGQQGIRNLRTIVDAAQRVLGLELDADQAYRVCLHLLGKAKEHPRDVTAYVLTCFEGSTEEVRDFIFKEVA